MGRREIRGKPEKLRSIPSWKVPVPVREFRGALIHPFQSKPFDIGVNVFIVSGYGGQTLETLALPGEGAPFERVTGFPLKSNVSAFFTYYFRRR
jgi:hypothetical protein